MNAPVTVDSVEPVSPGSAYSLAHLTDTELVAATRGFVAHSNRLLARLLCHLAEVEARGIFRLSACASLYTYCIYELRLSEDAAFRRARAARIARRFPVLFEQIAAGEIHLTGLLLLGPHLTEENHRDVLALAKHRTKREIEALVRRLDPLPDVPARVEPLGPAPGVLAPRNGTWQEMVASLSPVRQLQPGARPRDWAHESSSAPANNDPVGQEGLCADGRSCAEHADETGLGRASERYRVQFTANQEYVDLLDRAKDLLSHAVPSHSLEEIQLRAMRALVAELEKRKYAATERPRASAGAGSHARDPRQRGRTIPADVRRAVRARDEGRCTYVDARGQRCRETSLLELHHLQPFAMGGPATAENLALRCRAHNALAAEEDFGREHMLVRREAWEQPAGV